MENTCYLSLNEDSPPKIADPTLEGDNKLTEEEIEWVRELASAAQKEGVAVRNKFFLAAFALIAKGDVPKGLKRMKKWSKVEKDYNLNDISKDDATRWCLERFPGAFLATGPNIKGFPGFGMNSAKFFPYQIKTQQDWCYIAKIIELNMMAQQQTLSHVRRGIALFGAARGLSMANCSPVHEAKFASIYQNSYPIRIKHVYCIDPPSFVSWLMRMAKMVFSKKFSDRIHILPREELTQEFDHSDIPVELGGAYYEDYFAKRDRGLEQHWQSVKEVECCL